MTQIETPLEGGNISDVVRVGDTVRRQMGPWSQSVHGLLLQLEDQRFDGAPRYLGVDAKGREILTYLDGDVGSYPLQPFMWSDAALIGAGELLRRLHDATVGFSLPDAAWKYVDPDPARHEVICHNDIAPYNTVFVDGLPTGFIDFDNAGPGPRVWDLAYAAYTFVPLAGFVPLADGSTVPYEPLPHAAERRRRLRLLCDAYRLEGANNVVETVEQRLRAMGTDMVQRAAGGDPAYARLIEEGHLAHYQREVAFVQRHGQEWQLAW